ncbi:MAG: phosphoribosylaminoimidazolesuccinocarboxamide synthase [Methanomicrobiales archaeon]|nr:phosphoribosylaminoimidazolesuccinocarboxamide synthase [Methanomicrobiales archaeon]
MKQLDLLYSGKAKSVYRTENPGELLIKFRDDITAFDGQKKDTLAEKGSLNAGVSTFFFGILEKNGIKTHLVRKIDDTSLIARNLNMIPLEVIVRNIAAGSLVKNYPVEKGTPLNPPVIVIDFKDDTHHDPMLNDDLIFALKLATPDELREMKRIALRVNDVLQEYLGRRGIDLVDFKLEFGKKDGVIYVGDEISMDSMRLWDKKTGESLDKDVYRTGQGDVITCYHRVAIRIIAEE